MLENEDHPAARAALGVFAYVPPYVDGERTHGAIPKECHARGGRLSMNRCSGRTV